MSLFKKYNKPDTLVVISSYPKKLETYSQGVCAVASFTKNTIASLQQTSDFSKIVVLTMILDKEEVYEENGILIVRCFKRNTPLSYFNLLKALRSFSHAKNVLVEFEFASFGDTKSTMAILPLIWALYLSRKQVTLVVHQVVIDLQKISGHIGINSKKIISLLFNPALRLYYRLISYPVKSIVVLEDNLKKSLSTVVNPDKITVIPHGVPTISINKLTKKSARQQLNIKNEIVILYFGYLTWYKGVDFLIKTFLNKKNFNGKKIKLIVAGGPSFTQFEKPHYQKFISKIQTLLKNDPNHIQLTGFVDEKDIPLYFKASDLVIFPYRAFISSSGPLSFTLAYNKPFLLSENLGKLLESSDVKKSMAKAGISKNDLIFKYNHDSLLSKTALSVKNRQNKKLEKFSQLLAKERSFKKLSESYSKVILNPQITGKTWVLPRLTYRLPL